MSVILAIHVVLLFRTTSLMTAKGSFKVKNDREETLMTQRLFVPAFRLVLMVWIALFFTHSAAGAAPVPDLWSRWQAHAEESLVIVDNTAWDLILKKYLVTHHPSGINRFRYREVTPVDRQILQDYLSSLQQVKISSLNRQEQKAYWINLYNALTVQVILDHYPVKSIMDIDISPGLFANGPWDAKLLTIEGEQVSLNDIEHRILRPIFHDNRLHYALNCASLGCPDLQGIAYISANTEALLNTAARTFVNSARGARMENGRLYVSSIYKWFQVDFGGSEEAVVQHLRQYAEDGLAKVLQTYKDGLSDDYDWRLNSAE